MKYNYIYLIFLFSALSCTKFELPPIYENNTTAGGLESFRRESTADVKYGEFVYGAAITNDGHVIVNDRNTIKVWDGDNLIKTINNGESVRGMVLSQDEKWLYVLTTNGVVKIYSWPEGKVTKELPRSINSRVIKISRDGKTLVILETNPSNINNIRIWDLENTETSRVISFNNDYVNTNDVAVSPNGKYVSACGSRFLKVWESQSEKIVSDLSKTATSFFSIEFSGEGNTIVSKQTHFDRTYFWGINIYDFLNQVSLKKIDNLTNNYSLSISGDGNYCFTVNSYIDLVSQKIVWQTPSHQNLGYAAFTRFSANGKFVAYFDLNGSFNLYSNSGKQLNVTTGLFQPTFSSASFENNIYLMAGTQLMALSFDNNHKQLYNTPNNVTFNSKIAVDTKSILAMDCHTFYYWDIKRGVYEKSIYISDYTNRASWCGREMAKSSDNKYVAVQTPDNLDFIGVYDISTGRRIANLEGVAGYNNEGNGETLQNLVFSNDGKRLFIYEYDSGKIKNWNVETGIKNTDIEIQKVPDAELVVSPDNKVLLIARLGKLQFYDLVNEVFLDKVYDLPSSNHNQTYYDLNHLKFNPDGSKLAFSDGNSLTVFQFATSSKMESVMVDENIVGLEWDKSGTQLAVVTLKSVEFFKF